MALVPDDPARPIVGAPVVFSGFTQRQHIALAILTGFVGDSSIALALARSHPGEPLGAGLAAAAWQLADIFIAEE